MRIADILYISKGQFRRLEPSFQLELSPKRTETVYIGGYNPADPGTAEYYTLLWASEIEEFCVAVTRRRF